MLIPLSEYAAKHGKDFRMLRRKAKAGRFGTAVKIGRDWLIDSDEPCLNLHTREAKEKFRELYGDKVQDV